MALKLYDFWRSSAAYRVRIALNLKGLDYESVPTNLIKGGQKSPEYRAKNPQGLVPTLEVGDVRLTQSLAIIDWLDATYPEPRLIPLDPTARALEMAKALVIVADIHPLNNLRVLKYLREVLGQEEAATDIWYRHWITEGFTALEAMADPALPFLSGATPGLADCCLIPQMYNARRFDTALEAFPKLVQIDAACTELAPFKAAHPDAVRGEES